MNNVRINVNVINICLSLGNCCHKSLMIISLLIIIHSQISTWRHTQISSIHRQNGSPWVGRNNFGHKCMNSPKNVQTHSEKERFSVNKSACCGHKTRREKKEKFISRRKDNLHKRWEIEMQIMTLKINLFCVLFNCASFDVVFSDDYISISSFRCE